MVKETFKFGNFHMLAIISRLKLITLSARREINSKVYEIRKHVGEVLIPCAAAHTFTLYVSISSRMRMLKMFHIGEVIKK